MIVYDNSGWLSLIFRYRGTVLEQSWMPVLIIFIICCIVYNGEAFVSCELGLAGNTIFGPTMCYLLVFRANNASKRYWMGRMYLMNVFQSVREFIMLMCISLQGGQGSEAWRWLRADEEERRQVEDVNDIRASMTRVNIIRLALAFVVSLKLHTRICYCGYIDGKISGREKRLIDWDRLRLRGLVSRQEFEELNDLVPILHEAHVTRGAAFLTPALMDELLSTLNDDEEYDVDTAPDMRQPLAVLVKLRLEIMRHMNEPWGFKERLAKDFLTLFNQCSLLYEHITVIISTPIPFPYVHLCKVLLLCFLISTPLTMDAREGFVASVVMPTIVALALLGIDAIAIELENPFGDKANHLDIDSCISQLEDECMLMLDLAGDFRAKEAFQMLDVPEIIWGGDQGSILGSEEETLLGKYRDGASAPQFVCLRSQIRTEDDTPAASLEELPALTEVQKMTQSGGLGGKNMMGSLDGRPGSPHAGSQAGFKPMKEFGTETLVFEDADAKGGGNVEDFVGLNFEEEEEADGPLLDIEGGNPGQISPTHKGSSGDFQMMKFASQSIELEGPWTGDPPEDVVGMGSGEDKDLRKLLG
eukprot:TRINITY_DN16725_c0_g1_i1.p1 TRINITY_DN16725_c0_g1~~TRINITY_DN16725_c0_g1_i1.p1  ORF type:complete len:587 (+),score=127.72 TRINITY_DN16725_c0_g1_i1:64-1824(+)